MWWDTLRVHWTLVSIILEIMTSNCMNILIEIEMEVFMIERALQDVVSIWGQPWIHGRVGSNSALLQAQQKRNALLHVPPVVKPYGFRCCWPIYLIWRWKPLWFYVITKLYKDDGEPCVLWWFESHKDLVSLHSWYDSERIFKSPMCWHKWTGCRCVDQSPVSCKVWELLRQAWYSLKGPPLKGGVVLRYARLVLCFQLNCCNVKPV